MKLYIQNMVSLRCKMLVKAELERLNLHSVYLELGEVHLTQAITDEQRSQLKENLHRSGLELMDDKKAILIEKIKNVIVEMVHYSDELPQVNYSNFISQKLGRDYHTLSELFSKTKGITIEHYIIIHKIEKAKELIMYDELNLSEIADKLHYSSLAHLSHQFKKITGLTPSFFKSMQKRNRKNLEDL
ncbi:MAG: AraC family transcriptional regulator [Bacteroidetes bacterium]|nr:MAG: AraC family transcriptional regulator [Bacteroidota bacterium]